MGAAVGPDELIAQIAKINTNDESCTTHFVQAAGVEALQGDQAGSTAILAELQRRRDAAVDAAASTSLAIVVAKPESTFYLFPNVTEAMAAMEFTDVAEFADAALRAHGRLVLHPPALRPTLGGRDRAVRALRLLRDLGRRHRARARQVPPMDRGRLMLPRIVVAGRIPDAGLDVLRPHGNVWGWKHDDPIEVDELYERIAGADAVLTLLTTKVDRSFLDAAGGQLKVVSNVAVGYNNIDVAECRQRGVVTTNTPGVLTDATADIAMALILMVTRRLGEGERISPFGAALAVGHVHAARARACRAAASASSAWAPSGRLSPGGRRRSG